MLPLLGRPAVTAIQWHVFASPPSQASSDTRAMALYPLPAVYLPGSNHVIRNVEPRNIAMCRERKEFVAAFLHPDGSRCASVGALLQVDSVRPAARDTSCQVLASSTPSKVLQVQCTVVGRALIDSCQNPEQWRNPSKDQYLVANVLAYEDAEGDEVLDAASLEEVEDELFGLIDSLLDNPEEEGAIDVGAAVASLEEAAALASAGRLWAALDSWQVHCTTRKAAAAWLARAERNEFLVDAKLKEGGALSIPIDERTLGLEDRAKLADLDRRAAEAAAQLGLDDVQTFQRVLESQTAAERLALLREGVRREASRLARRAALRRAYDAS